MNAKEILSEVVATMFSRGMSKVDFARELSRFEKRKTNPANMITMYRWFTGEHQPKPSTLCAMQKWLDSHKSKPQ